MNKENINIHDIVFPNKINNFKHSVFDMMVQIFSVLKSMNCCFINSKEVVNTIECFDNLLVKPDHPSRHENDTFYLNQTQILSTQSTVFWNYALQFYPRIKSFFTISKVYRKDTSSARHFPIFHQCDLLKLDIKFQNIKSFIDIVLYKIFNKPIEYRFRGSYFPYTRFSSEVDIKCFYCINNNKLLTNCSVCQNNKWIEIMGFGVPKFSILEHISKKNFDKSNTLGLAFGIGIERLCMIKYNIHDIRSFYV